MQGLQSSDEALASVVVIGGGFIRRQRQLWSSKVAASFAGGGGFSCQRRLLYLSDELALVVGGAGYGCRSSGFA